MSHHRTILILTAAALVGVAAVVLLRPRWAQNDDAGHHDVRVTVVPVGRTVLERGWLVSLDSTPVVIGASGEIMEITESGTEVRKGDVVVRIDDSSARDRLEESEFNLTSSRQDVESSKASYNHTELAESNRIQALRNALAYAKLNYDDARRGLTPEDQRLLQIELDIARLDAEEADEELAQQRRLFDKGFVSSLAVERYERRAATAHATVEEVKARIRLEEKGVPEERLLELEMEVQRLQGLVDRGERRKARSLEAVMGWQRVSLAHVARTEFGRVRVLEEIEHAATRAPASGILAVRMHHGGMGRGWTEYRPGEQRWKGEQLADIVNPGRMKVELMVHEADADLIDIGMPARIRLPAFPGRVFPGEVNEIGRVGRDRVDVAPRGYETGRSGVTMFNATVTIEGGETEFRPGMSAMVESRLEPERPRLVVPRAAVTASPEGPTVQRRHGDTYDTVVLRGRPLGAHHFLVEDGLDEGDSVGMPAPLEEAP